MNSIVVRLLIVVFSYATSVLTAVYFGRVYDYLTPGSSGGSFIGTPDAWNWLVGYPLGTIFLLTLLMHTQGSKHVWWWNIITLTPMILFELLLDPLHIYLPVILGVVAWKLGNMANKALWKLAPGVMAKIG